MVDMRTLAPETPGKPVIADSPMLAIKVASRMKVPR